MKNKISRSHRKFLSRQLRKYQKKVERYKLQRRWGVEHTVEQEDTFLNNHQKLNEIKAELGYGKQV